MPSVLGGISAALQPFQAVIAGLATAPETVRFHRPKSPEDIHVINVDRKLRMDKVCIRKWGQMVLAKKVPAKTQS